MVCVVVEAEESKYASYVVRLVLFGATSWVIYL
jgi:hypothetical protein